MIKQKSRSNVLLSDCMRLILVNIDLNILSKANSSDIDMTTIQQIAASNYSMMQLLLVVLIVSMKHMLLVVLLGSTNSGVTMPMPMDRLMHMDMIMLLSILWVLALHVCHAGICWVCR